nr:hypothetical protein [Tanacetum cinerariifolium]
MMISFLQMHSPSGSRLLSSNTIPNPRGEIKAITTQSGIVLNGPSVPPPLPFYSPKEVEHKPESIMNQVPTESTIRVPPLIFQSPPTATSSDLLKRYPHQPLIPYPSRLNKEKLQTSLVYKFTSSYKCLRNFTSISVLQKL